MKIDSLTGHLPSFINQKSEPLEIFSVDSVDSVTVDIDARTVTITAGAVTDTIDVAGLGVAITDKLVSNIKTAIAALGYSITVADSTYDGLAWFVLASGKDASGKVYYDQSVLRRFMGAIAQFFVDLKAGVDDAVKQIYLKDAEEHWLHYWGGYFGWPPYEGESDELYYARVIHEIISLKTNDVALTNLIAKTDIAGVEVGTRADRHNEFDVLIYSTFEELTAYQRTAIQDIMTKYRAAGNIPIYYTQSGVINTAMFKLSALTVTYVANNQFKVTGDYTTLFADDRLLIINISGTGDKLCAVTSASYAGGETTVTIDNQLLTAVALTVKYAIGLVISDIGHTWAQEGSNNKFKATGGDYTADYVAKDVLYIQQAVTGEYVPAKIVSSVFSSPDTVVAIEETFLDTVSALDIRHLTGGTVNDLNYTVAPNEAGWTEVTL